MSQYYIDGPVQLGTNLQNTNIRGNIILTDTTTTAGDIVYANGSNILQRLGITNNGVLIGQATSPVWLSPGANNLVLTMVTGSPAWASPQADASQYGFFVKKITPDITTTGTSESVIGGWNPGAYTDPEYDSTLGAFAASTGLFTVPGLSSEESIWSANASITFTQSSNNNNTVTDVHIARILLNAVVIASTKVTPGPRNNNINTFNAQLYVNFKAKGTDVVSVDVACKNGGSITVKFGDVTSLGIVKLANA